jgi:toxin YoeB
MANHKTKNKQQAEAVAVSWTDHAWEEYLWWHKNDPMIVEEIDGLIEE